MRGTESQSRDTGVDQGECADGSAGSACGRGPRRGAARGPGCTSRRAAVFPWGGAGLGRNGYFSPTETPFQKRPFCCMDVNPRVPSAHTGGPGGV